jgi:hypothetical protein
VKFASGNWKNVVRAILTLQSIYHITSVDLQEEVLKKIVSLLRPDLLAGDRRKMQGKLGKNCRPTKLGGLGILHLDKFSNCHHPKMCLEMGR